MIEPRLFVCSGAQIAPGDPNTVGRKRIELDSIGSKTNVNIRFENISKVVQQNLTPRLKDLLEIAAYVYSADCSTRRGTEWTDGGTTESWGRDFAFVIPVRDLEFWSSEKIGSQLTEVLSFLSDDKYSFTFTSLKHDRPMQEYFEFGDSKDWAFHGPERVLMFSGGLDSLAGAVETASSGGKLVLVSHRPVTTLGSRQKKLFQELLAKFPGQLIHVPIMLNKNQRFEQEPTQRTRSFLYASPGTIVAESIQAGGVRFFENGIVSLNLPVADEAIRARASRTTHPVVLHQLQSLCSEVTARDFVVDNPYLLKTKTDVVTSLTANQAAHLIRHTCSCAHMIFKPKSQWHCGRCSQCIDRRFAIMAAGLSQYDPETDYETDVFTGHRKDGPEKNMAVDYTRHAIELSQRSEHQLATLFNAELSRAVRYEPKRGQAAEQLIFIHKRHGECVTGVLREKIREQAENIVKGTLDASSLLALVVGRKHLVSDQGRMTVGPTIQLESATAVRLGESMEMLLARIGKPLSGRTQKKGKLGKRDTILFAAILLGLEGLKYCAFLHDRGIRPKWSDTGPNMYPKSYQLGEPWRKRIQDEKTRAKSRMTRYEDSEIVDAVNTHLSDKFHEISRLLPTRAARAGHSVSVEVS